MRGVFVSTQNKVAHYSEQAKKITKESVQEIKKQISTNETVDAIEKKLARARIGELEKEPAESLVENPVNIEVNNISNNNGQKENTQSWTTKQLKNANSFINGLILGIEDFIFAPEEHHTVSKVDKPQVKKRSDSLEWFE